MNELHIHISVPISDLDFIGRTAFEGMKNLNRIQSVVCDTAYRTNQNMLVCAPTGAGMNLATIIKPFNLEKNCFNSLKHHSLSI